MKRFSFGNIFSILLLVLFTYIPFFTVLENSIKSDTQIAANPLGILWTFHSGNYMSAWNGMVRYLGNTVIVAIISVMIAIPVAAAAGYVFATMRFRGKTLLFYCFLGLLMIPWTLTLIPLFLEVKTFHLYGTWWALILPYAAGSQPLLVYLFRVFFEGIPEELFESARLDGCSEFGILLRIVTPLSVPILLTGTVLMFINIWGDYLWPTVAISDYHLFTVSAGLQTYLGSFGQSGHGAGAAYAAYLLAMGPIILLLLGSMKYFVNGVTAGAVKG
ncbi:carbohydrate ABC transporter permease [Fodinisporobacter ferrooxydans]|uniref:Carbohydrate ABC transporter permease n=1 Tax=Fodinisporobacter ferrooxydans TaxID=2901836 RepID=A0ABY4CGL8_9BACL|nr:carbohydrate ABC transporter permease [Alicyclobacillaceae bacterium MYW30-H2]